MDLRKLYQISATYNTCWGTTIKHLAYALQALDIAKKLKKTIIDCVREQVVG